MTIVNVYQLILLCTIGVVAFFCRKSLATAGSQPFVSPVQVEHLQLASPEVATRKGNWKEEIKALDLLFDSNKLSVDEYVEMRRRIAHP